MTSKYQELAFTDSVQAAQAHYFGRAAHVDRGDPDDVLGEAEIEFIRARDSFYMATVGETGWPYMQHRGGKPGFLRTVDDKTLVFADYRGNRQLISTGNVATNDRVALFLMDYPNRARLKILGRARTEDARQHPELVARWAELDVQRIVERLFFVEIVAFDWNCPKYITPRFTREEVDAVIAPLRQRIAELESELARSSDS